VRLLKNHLLARVLGFDDEDMFTTQDRLSLTIVNDQMYRHKVLRINYTTYDMRRAQDAINPRTHPFFMMLSQDDEHPYCYAQAISVFHVP